LFLSAKDRCLTWMLRLLAGLTALLVLLIVLFVIRESWSALAAIGMGRWWTDASWHPADDSLSGSFRLWPLLAGTLSVSWLALLLAVPLGLQSAIFLQFYAPRPLAWWYRRVLEVMAGIPSVVYGLWGLVVLVPLVNRLRPPGASLLAGGIILALMILPTLSLLADIALACVSREYLRGVRRRIAWCCRPRDRVCWRR
jgi:phosphate transport system permease protein